MSFTLLRRLITTAVGLGLVFALTRQCRKPTGWLGRRITRAMNLGHAPLTAWGLSHADIGQHARILDIGRPYLGDVVGVYGDWTPLAGRERLFPEDLDRGDEVERRVRKWQLRYRRLLDRHAARLNQVRVALA